MSRRTHRRASNFTPRPANDNASRHRTIELEGFDDRPVEFVEIEVFSVIVGSLVEVAANDNDPPPQTHVA